MLIEVKSTGEATREGNDVRPEVRLPKFGIKFFVEILQNGNHSERHLKHQL